MKFSKYSSAGNDFLIVEKHEKDAVQLIPQQWEKVCSRATGVGADGVLFLKRNPFEMEYINSDGHPAEMCGNGLRAICSYIAETESSITWPLEVKTQKFIYKAKREDQKIWVEMSDLSEAGKIDVFDLYAEALDSYFINTGVPHAVFQVRDVDKVDLKNIAPIIRADKRFPNGSNVNFFQVVSPGVLRMRVFERGVEGETLSSGTGTTAVAMAYRHLHQYDGDIKISPPGGLMEIKFENGVPWLTGPVTEVYQAQLSSTFLAKL